MAMESFDLSKGYNRDSFITFLRGFLPDNFQIENQENIDLGFKSKYIEKVSIIGKATIKGGFNDQELFIFEIKHSSGNDPRVTLTKETFKLLRKHGRSKSLCVYINEKSPEQYRLSLVTFDVAIENGKLEHKFSNPKRFSYILGAGAKTHTPYEYLIKKGKVKDFEDLKNRFSIEIVNSEFYKEIAQLFTELVGGKRDDFNGGEGVLKLPSTDDHESKKEFGVRLLGRLIFCWFLKKKGLIGENVLSKDKIDGTTLGFYHSVLEPLFFQVLNKEIKNRKEEFRKEEFDNIPFLNGGLFAPGGYDFYEESYDGYNKNINNFKIPNEWFKKLFDILEIYNFTIDESSSFDVEISIDPEMLGMIFENLLAEITPETSETAKKSTGSFYTPRPIVEFMVDESLKYYLVNKTGIDEKKIENLVLFFTEQDNEYELSDDEKEKLIDALDKLKILDPACGSGAFPIAILHKIVFILKKLDPDSEKWIEKKYGNIKEEVIKNDLIEKAKKKSLDYVFKLSIIQNSIYGVDIQEIAVEISKLRFFLSLIVEEVINKEERNLGIQPLPNLEFKFVCADSLRSLKKNKKEKIEGGRKYTGEDSLHIFGNANYEDKLKKLREKYLNSHGILREDIKKEFVKIQKELFKITILSKGITDYESSLSTWDPFSGEKTDWFDPFWMFGIKNGFDIVIGNPPYIQLQKNGGNKANLYEDEGFDTFVRSGDIYCLFYEKGLKLLNQEGILTYITSNKWMRAGYGEKLRSFLVKYNPLKLIDLGPGIFNSATVDTNILIVQNKKTDGHILKAITLKNKDGIANLRDRDFINLTNLSGDSWIILSQEEQRIKEKIEKVGTPLKDWDISINYGIKTGCNEAFIIDGKTKDELIAQDPKSAEIIKPILRGRDIKRYKAEFADKWLIATFPALNLNIDDYIAIKKHLEQFLPKIKQTGETFIDKNGQKQKTRKRTGNKWFETQDQIAYYHEFEKEKIVWAETGQELKFIFDTERYFLDKTTFLMITKEPKYFLGFLNSKLADFYLRKFIAPGLGKNGLQLAKIYVEKIPIPKIPKSQQLPFEKLVDIIISKKKRGEDTIEEERKIDEMVYNLYNLTPEEIQIIESRFK